MEGYKFIELSKNEIPYKDVKIYPDFEIKDGIIHEIEYGDTWKYVKQYKTLVPIIRGGIKYLIPFMKKNVWKIEDVNDDILDLFHKIVTEECNNIKDKYIINESIQFGDGRPLIIYKYKD